MEVREKETHFPISEDVKRSPMVPAVTQWNAALKKPVMKREAIRRAGVGHNSYVKMLGELGDKTHRHWGKMRPARKR